MIEKLFKLTEHNTTFKTELTAGLTTFLTMAYIILVNPMILSSTGIPFGAAFVATCIAAALGCLLMGLMSNFPVSVAPSMALNVYFSYVIVAGLGYPWQAALTAVMVSGVLFLLLTMVGVCKHIMKAIPSSMTVSVCAGIGLFIALLALKNGGIIVSNPKTIVQLGNLGTIKALLFLLGFMAIVSLDYLRVPGALLIGILGTTLLGFVLGVGHFKGVFAMPPSVSGSFLHFSFLHMFTVQNLSVIFTFFLVILFDSVGTMVGVLHHTGIWKEHDRSPRITRALLANGIATVVGSCFGTSSTSPYIESMSGIRAGARTGLSMVVVALLFLLALFFAPLAATIPSYATAPALLFVACLMSKGLVDIDWQDMTESVPAMITFMMIPFSFSISDGIGVGFISYSIIKLFCGKAKEVKPMMWVMTLIFIIYFMFRPAI